MSDNEGTPVSYPPMLWSASWPYWWMPPEGADLDREAKRLGFPPEVFRKWIATKREEVEEAKKRRHYRQDRMERGVMGDGGGKPWSLK